MTPDKVEAALDMLRNTIRMSEAQADIDGGKNATQYQRGRADVSKHTAKELRDLLSVLTEALAERERDAVRLDWLEDSARCYHVEIQSQPSGNYVFKGQGQFLRYAIDLAMKDTDHAR